MRLHTRLTSLLRNHPYQRPFNSRSASYKSAAVTMVHELASHLSGQQPGDLYQYFSSHSRIGKEIFPNMRNVERASRMLTNLKVMHTGAPVKHKSNLLSLVAGLFSRNELGKLGFCFSRTQYTTAKQKAAQNIFSLSNYIHHILPSH